MFFDELCCFCVFYAAAMLLVLCMCCYSLYIHKPKTNAVHTQ
jgi:hypothetical protein